MYDWVKFCRFVWVYPQPDPHLQNKKNKIRPTSIHQACRLGDLGLKCRWIELVWADLAGGRIFAHPYSTHIPILDI